jgi:hypothetical protein
VQTKLRASGESIPLTLTTLKKRLRDRKLITTQSEQRDDGTVERLDVQRHLEGRRQRVLWMKLEVLGFDETLLLCPEPSCRQCWNSDFREEAGASICNHCHPRTPSAA